MAMPCPETVIIEEAGRSDLAEFCENNNFQRAKPMRDGDDVHADDSIPRWRRGGVSSRRLSAAR